MFLSDLVYILNIFLLIVDRLCLIRYSLGNYEKRLFMPARVKIPAEVYSRISGYFRPVNQWNRGKQEEFLNRATVNVCSLSGEMILSSSEGLNTAVSISSDRFH